MTRARTQHVLEVPHELRALVHARRGVGDVDTCFTRSSSSSIFAITLSSMRVVALDGAVAQHHLAELLVQHVGVLGVLRPGSA